MSEANAWLVGKRQCVLCTLHVPVSAISLLISCIAFFTFCPSEDIKSNLSGYKSLMAVMALLLIVWYMYAQSRMITDACSKLARSLQPLPYNYCWTDWASSLQLLVLLFVLQETCVIHSVEFLFNTIEKSYTPDVIHNGSREEWAMSISNCRCLSSVCYGKS